MPLLSRHLVAFLAAVLRSPATVGAVAPSSPHLAARLAAVVPRVGEPVVVELGPGTGSVTAAIGYRLAGRGRHVAVEIDPVLVNYLRAEHAGVEVLGGDAAELERLFAEHQVSAVDAIVSGLPWSLIDADTQSAIVDATARSLRLGGCFTTFAYLHALSTTRARQFRALLGEVFDEVLTTRTVWWNLPPAVTYVCRRPRAIRPGADGRSGAAG
ncbi:MAG: methyltransferase domain-containing protein [Streptosporangiaceae bacterium]|nr:methyltransferase domain-containing protein [Pseudonocardiales bacterium]MBV9447329.1 methyltransferase domain-containing protein [Streptosporangiaceae bacterium]